MKFNKRKNYLIGIDTETCNSLTDKQGKLDLSNSLVYDVGWAITDLKGKIYKTRSFIVKEIFFDEELMSNAYFADKMPQYFSDIEAGTRKIKNFLEIRRQFFYDRKMCHAHAVFAHNAYFDYNSLNTTLRYLTGSKYRYFFPYNLEIWDTLKMSRDAIGKTKKYSDYCQKNGYLTNHKHPQNRLTAEILWRYLSNNPDFQESHTGLEDVQIETEIMAYCLKTHKPIRKALFNKRV